MASEPPVAVKEGHSRRMAAVRTNRCAGLVETRLPPEPVVGCEIISAAAR
jgi:hypothetical protein